MYNSVYSMYIYAICDFCNNPNRRSGVLAWTNSRLAYICSLKQTFGKHAFWQTFICEHLFWQTNIRANICSGIQVFWQTYVCVLPGIGKHAFGKQVFYRLPSGETYVLVLGGGVPINTPKCKKAVL